MQYAIPFQRITAYPGAYGEAPPRIRQRPDKEGTGALRSPHAGEQSTAHQERDENNATDNEFPHDTCSFV